MTSYLSLTRAGRSFWGNFAGLVTLRCQVIVFRTYFTVTSRSSPILALKTKPCVPRPWKRRNLMLSGSEKRRRRSGSNAAQSVCGGRRPLGPMTERENYLMLEKTTYRCWGWVELYVGGGESWPCLVRQERGVRVRAFRSVARIIINVHASHSVAQQPLRCCVCSPGGSPDTSQHLLT